MFSKAVLLAVLIACVCTAVIAVHWPTLSAQALSFDDDQYLTNNALVKSPSWLSAWKFLSQVLAPSTVGGYYQPLAMISLMCDYSLGGRVENLMPFHRTSLALHTANTALIIVLLYMLFGEVWLAAAVGLLFGLHPMTVEPIPWVGERKTLLAAFFALWSLLFYLRHARSSDDYNLKSTIRNLQSKNLWFCFLFYLLALISKPTSTPLPLLMLLLDFWPLRRLNWPTVLEKIPFFTLGGIFIVITYISQTCTAGSVPPTEARILHIALVLCHNIIFYLYKIIWPVNLSSHYPFPDPLNLSEPMVLAGVIGTCILIPLLLISLRWTRAAFTGGLFFFVAILPTMQIVRFSDVIASDKFAYLPSFGLLMLLTFFLCKSKIQSVSRRKRGYTIVVTILVLSVASAESLATRSYLVHWRTSVGLFKYMLSKAPNAPSLHGNLGNAYDKLGLHDEAIESYKQVIRIVPYDVKAHNNLGNTYGLGRYQEAIDAFRQAIRIKPDYVDAHYNLGIAYGKLSRYQEAIDACKQAIRIKPDYAEAHYNLGVAYGNRGRWQEAMDACKQAIRIRPDYAEAHYNLGVAYGNLGRYQEAIDACKQAISIKPDYAEAYNNLGLAYGNLGRWQEEIEAYRQAIRIRPDYAEAYYGLGFVFAQQSKFNEAIMPLTESLRLDPNCAKTHFCLANVMSEQRKYEQAVLHFKEALRLDPDNAEYLNALAWLLATSKEPTFRNPEEAVKLAEKACELTGSREFLVLDTLAAAYAASGKFPEAVSTAEKALQLAAGSSQNKELVKDFENRLSIYKAGRAYIEP